MREHALAKAMSKNCAQVSAVRNPVLIRRVERCDCVKYALDQVFRRFCELWRRL